MTFSTFFKSKRISLRITLRAFCLKHNFDPSYTSKLERGRISAPQDQEMLNRYMVALELDEAERRECVTLAAISAENPPEPLTEEEFVKNLPVIIHCDKTSIDKLQKLVDWLRERM